MSIIICNIELVYKVNKDQEYIEVEHLSGIRELLWFMISNIFAK